MTRQSQDSDHRARASITGQRRVVPLAVSLMTSVLRTNSRLVSEEEELVLRDACRAETSETGIDRSVNHRIPFVRRRRFSAMNSFQDPRIRSRAPETGIDESVTNRRPFCDMRKGTGGSGSRGSTTPDLKLIDDGSGHATDDTDHSGDLSRDELDQSMAVVRKI
mmetsp:Transcript_128/g.314  ORF Transcript_128/g.314 Transcript_128/m.314 type:complete len:164 (+) Transcript_128:217-708(+)